MPVFRSLNHLSFTPFLMHTFLLLIKYEMRGSLSLTPYPNIHSFSQEDILPFQQSAKPLAPCGSRGMDLSCAYKHFPEPTELLATSLLPLQIDSLE